jgi:hypothetical protein
MAEWMDFVKCSKKKRYAHKANLKADQKRIDKNHEIIAYSTALSRKPDRRCRDHPPDPVENQDKRRRPHA